MRAAVVNLPDPTGANMVKDLLNGAWCRGARIGGTSMPPLSLLYAYTVCARGGVHAELHDAVQEGASAEALAARLRGADLLVAHSSGYTFEDDLRSLRLLRAEQPGTRVFVFGNLGPAEVEGLLDAGAADWVRVGDPEHALADLLEAGLDEGARPGLATRAVRTPEARPLRPLDELPLPDRRPLLGRRYRNLLALTDRWTTALTSRGCPFACTFCNTPGYYARSYRRHGLDYVLEDLRALRGLGFEEVFFRDDLLYAGRVEELCEALLRADLGLVWSCNHRVDTLDRPTLALMRRAGCHTIKFGVESGDEATLAAVGKPPVEQARATFAACRELGLRTHAHLVVGLPGETRRSMERTTALLRELDPWSFSLNLFTPHRGSALHEQLAAEGALPAGGRWKEALRGNPSLVPDAELHALLRRTYLREYLAPRRVLRLVSSSRHRRALAGSGFQLLRAFAGRAA